MPQQSTSPSTSKNPLNIRGLFDLRKIRTLCIHITGNNNQMAWRFMAGSGAVPEALRVRRSRCEEVDGIAGAQLEGARVPIM